MPLDRGEPTLPGVLAENGYATRAIGKVHLTPFEAEASAKMEESNSMWESGAMRGWNGPYYGFQRVELVVNHGEYTTKHGHYAEWVRSKCPDIEKKLGKENATAPGTGMPYSWNSGLPVELHNSTFVAERSIEFIRQIGNKPFFLFASFPDPHEPFTPPAPYSTMFDGADLPAPCRREGENNERPEPYRRRENVDNWNNCHRLKDEQIGEAVAHTYGMVSLADHCIGRVMDCVKECGLWDDTVVVFTSDHGQLLRDHNILLKSPVLHLHELSRVSCIMRAPGVRSPGATVPWVSSNTDIMPTLLDLVGVEAPEGLQGRSLVPTLHDPSRGIHDGVLSMGARGARSKAAVLTLHTDRYRLSYYPALDDGELVDFANDPAGQTNLFHRREMCGVREELLRKLLRRSHEMAVPHPPRICPY